MEKIESITIEFETYKQTLKGEEAHEWFEAMANMLHGKIPMSIVMAKWNKRKKKGTSQNLRSKEYEG